MPFPIIGIIVHAGNEDDAGESPLTKRIDFQTDPSRYRHWRVAYDGAPLPIEREEIRVAEITTRDIDRGGFPHFLLKSLAVVVETLLRTEVQRTVERDHPLPDKSELWRSAAVSTSPTI